MNVEQALPGEMGKSDFRWRLIAFTLLTLVLGFCFRDTIVALARLSLKDETFSHMPLIPLVSAYFLYNRRRWIFSEVHGDFLWGILLAGVGLSLWLFGSTYPGATVHKDQLSLNMLAVLVIWEGGFLGLFGRHTFRSAGFPLLFLIFLVPIPTFMLGKIVYVLQRASAEIANGLFLLLGVPFLRNDFVFELPGMSVMVAKECSGIRSSISLLITGILAAYLGLNSPWRRGILILSVIPITVFKNALRVITLSLLGAYVDPRIMDSALHRAGGIPFFMLAVLLFGGVFWLLRRSEVKARPMSQN